MGKKNQIKIFFICLILVDFFPRFAFSASLPFPREVICLWSSKESGSISDNPASLALEFPLQLLGMRTRLIDIDTQTLPPASELIQDNKVRAVATLFFSESLVNHQKLFRWLNSLAQTRLKWIAFGSFGFLSQIPAANLNEFFLRWGAEYQHFETKPFGLKVIKNQAAVLDFERKSPEWVDDFVTLRVRAHAGETLLAMGSPKGAQESILFSQIAHSAKNFSWAYGNFGLFSDVGSERRQWVVNPILFLQRALGLPKEMIVPDVSVLNGRRIAFLHTDGDGFSSEAHFEKQPEPLSGEVIRDEILLRNPDIPFGVSFIASEVLSRHLGNERTESIVKSFGNLKNVEFATHTFFHPLNWMRGTTSFDDGSREKIDLEIEILKSRSAIAKLLQKKESEVETIYWSGGCVPGERAMRMTKAAGLYNLNGGDSRFDTVFPSLAFLAPLGRPWASGFQVFSGNANDFIYTDGFTKNYRGFESVIQTYENTGLNSPLGFTLKPANAYFHFYSGERPQSLLALKNIIRWFKAHSEEIALVPPTTYIRAVEGFLETDFYHELGKPNTLEIRNVGNVADFRLEDPGFCVSSKDFMGSVRIKNKTYLHPMPHRQNLKVQIYRSPHCRFMNSSLPFALQSVGGVVDAFDVLPTKKGIRVKLAAWARGPLILEARDTSLEGVTVVGGKVRSKDKRILALDFEVKSVPQTIEVRRL